MIGSLDAAVDATSDAVVDAALDATLVRAWAARLGAGVRELSDAERVEFLRAVEELKAAGAAAQAQVTVAFEASQRAAQAAAGVPARRQGRGIVEQVALARRVSPDQASTCVGLAKALVEMPHTLAALRAGRLSEWRATLLVRETACLTREGRARADVELAGPEAVEDLTGMGDQRLVAAAKKVAYRLEPRSVVDRARRAPDQRRVTLRPAPDTMTYLSALLPVAHGVACLAALSGAADTARASGDPRSRGQVMADALVTALTGATAGTGGTADAAGAAGAADTGGAGGTGGTVPRAPGVALSLVMTDRALLRGDDEPAHLIGYGTVPAAWARDLLRASEGQVWLRRLFTHPGSGELLDADKTARRFPRRLREVLIARDRTCRTPWCDAPIRHADHISGYALGAGTTLDDGQGLCERCNYAKQGYGWAAQPDPHPGQRHTVTTITPTGHTYRSQAPPLPGTGPTSQSGRQLRWLGRVIDVNRERHHAA
jgi:hypothetical protein